jgi:hypothetical protein
MKTKEEIEQLSYKYSDKVNMFNDWTSHSIADAVTYGYTQCQKDMADDLEAILNNSIYVDFISKKEIVKYLKSLNKQD